MPVFAPGHVKRRMRNHFVMNANSQGRVPKPRNYTTGKPTPPAKVKTERYFQRLARKITRMFRK